MPLKYHGSKCRWCHHFPECSKPQVKNVRENSEYCHWPDNRFEVAAAPAMDETPIFHQMEEGGELE